MNHDEIRDLLPAYAVGAVDPEERAVVEAHLATCAACRAELKSYEALAEDMLYAVPPTAAPPRLEARLRAAIRQEKESGSRREAFYRRVLPLAAGIALLLGANLYWAVQVRELRSQLQVQATALAALAEAPAVTLVGDVAAPEAKGVLYMRPDAHVALLHVYNLPPLPSDKAYQVWLIHDGKRDSAALFQVQGQRELVVLIQAPRPFREYDAIGITIEPAGGSPGPTGPRVLFAPF